MASCAVIWIALVCVTVCLQNSGGVRTPEEWRSRVIYQILVDRFSAEGPDPTQPCTDLRSWCGGSYKGIIQRLDYIQNLGADAIWISPIIEQTTGGYHGYWAKNISAIEPHWGSRQDLHDLVTALHDRDMWLMVDVVPNHMGYPEGCNDTTPCTDEESVNFSELVPFNEAKHFHSLCHINWTTNIQSNLELCRLANLPDLNQTFPFVRQTLLQWITDLTAEFNIDGYRVDTVRHIEMAFWHEYQAAANTFCMGEVFHTTDAAYPAAYQEALDSVTNYPMYSKLEDAFINRRPFTDFRAGLQDQRENFKDTSVLTIFIDNHDVSRFLGQQADKTLLRNALTYISYGEGIPIIYYGTEQNFAGTKDPENRESLWPHYDQDTDTYQFLRTMLTHRNRLLIGPTTGQMEHDVVYNPDDDVLVFSRNDQQVLVVLNNMGSGGHKLLDFEGFTGTTNQEYVNIQNADDRLSILDGIVTIMITDGEPEVYELVERSESGSPALFGLTSYFLLISSMFTVMCGLQ